MRLGTPLCVYQLKLPFLYTQRRWTICSDGQSWRIGREGGATVSFISPPIYIEIVQNLAYECCFELNQGTMLALHLNRSLLHQFLAQCVIGVRQNGFRNTLEPQVLIVIEKRRV